MVNPQEIPNLDAFVAALERHPVIEGWAFGGGHGMDGKGHIDLWVSPSQHKQVLHLTTVSPGFFATYDMTVLAGEPKTGLGETHVVIDAKAAKALGFANPQAAVGALVRGGGGFLQEGNEPRRVVAVVNDVKLESAREAAMPQGFVLSDEPQWDISIHGSDLAAARQAVDELWTMHGPKLPYMIESVDELRASVYQQEQQMTTMVAAVALLAVGVAMLGAYALVSDSLRRRRTELVLHRLHGADHLAIARLVTTEFFVPLLIAAAVGLPVGVWLAQVYLAGFVDRVDPFNGIVVPIIAACATILLVTAIAALRHVRLGLTIQPAEALR
jgi:hypothetical protein